MIFAVVPWNKKFNNNELFNVNSATNKNGLAEPFAELKEFIESKGHQIVTVDLISDYTQVDFYLFFDWIEEWIDKLNRMGLSYKFVYCNAEPPTVRKLNTPEGYKTVRKLFPYIMTWNKGLVDDKVFFYRTIPYNFVEHYDDIPWEDKKLLTSISANKKSDYQDELYSEREKLISFFEKSIPEQFDMYGVGWERSNHSSYKGRPESKFETYKKYKFAIALENTKNVKGYVTEKIFDCLTGNIVPIYMGAEDISDYVSKDCFIDYRDYNEPEDLLEYLLSVDKKRYLDYMTSAKAAIEKIKKSGEFSGRLYGENILYLAENAHNNGYKADMLASFILHLKVLKNIISYSMKRIIKVRLR